MISASLDKCWDSIADTKQNDTCETLGWGLMSGYYTIHIRLSHKE
jgi:hypothetical protein